MIKINVLKKIFVWLKVIGGFGLVGWGISLLLDCRHYHKGMYEAGRWVTDEWSVIIGVILIGSGVLISLKQGRQILDWLPPSKS